MKHLSLTLLSALLAMSTVSAQSSGGSNEETGSEPTPTGSVTVLSGETQIDEITRWDDGAPEGVKFRGSGRIEVTIPRAVGEESSASVVYYSLDVSPALNTDPEERFLVELGGVVIGLQCFANVQNIPTGEVTYKVSGSADLFEKASVYFALVDDYTAPIAMRLTASLDQGRSTWDLYVRGQRWLTDLPYTPGDEKIVLESNGELSTIVRNMNISSINPFESE